MKRKIIKKVFLLLSIAVIYFIFFAGTENFSEVKQAIISTTMLKDFTNFVLADQHRDGNSVWNIENQMPGYKDLNFNAAHFYESDTGYTELGTFGQDSLEGYQRTNVRNILSLANTNGMKSVIARKRIRELCFSQRLVYEISNGGSTNLNYGFCYQNCMSNAYTTDSGRTVLHATTIPADNFSAGWLCNNIYENMQHTDLYYFGPGKSDLTNWHVKPVMRIKQSDFNNSALLNTPVVRINVVNYSGDTINKVVLRVSNFRDGNSQYSGKYIDKYTFQNNFDSLQIFGDQSSDGLNYGYAQGKDPKNSKVDFKVYWPGLVEVWFDKMVVDDERANILFDTTLNLSFNKKIKDEATSFGDSLTFFIDEIVSSQAYSTKYVIDKLKFYKPEAKLSMAISNNLNRFSHRQPEYSSKMLLDITRPDIVQIDAHPFPLQDSYGGLIPENILSSGWSKDSRIPSDWYVNDNDKIETTREFYADVVVEDVRNKMEKK